MSSRPSKRGNKIERCYRLAALLAEGKALDRNIVMDELQVGPATADRHLRVIRTKMKVTAKPKGGRTVLRAERHSTSAALNHATIAAACIAASLARLFHTTPLQSRMKTAVARLLEASHDSSLFAEYERQFLFVARGGERALHRKGSARLDSIIDAIVERRTLRLRHRRFDGSSMKTYIRPLSLALHEHQLYLIGLVGEQLENIRFSRISAAFKTKESFEYPSPAQYDPAKVFRDSLGIFIKDDLENGISVCKVKLRLNKRWLPYVRTHRWHHSQRHHVEGDAVILEFYLRTCRELDRLILGFGPDAEVLAPADLRDRIAARARALAALYEQKP